MQLLITVTAVVFSISHSVASAAWCPFFPAASLDIAEEIQQCDHLLLGKWVGGEKSTDVRGGSSTFEIIEVGFSKGDRFQKGQLVVMPQYMAGSITATYSLMGPEDSLEDWHSPFEVSADAWAYLSKMPLPVTDPKSQTERLMYFLPFFKHKDQLVSNDAIAEFAAAPYEVIVPLKDKLPREDIMKWLADPKTPVTRIGFYGLMAGLCGHPEDAEILEKKIVSMNGDFRQGIEGVMAGYLLLRGEDGLKVLEDTKMRSRVAKNVEGKELPLPFSETYAVMQALRFLWTYEPDRLPKERLRQSMRILLDRPELADLAITDLARWHDWNIQDQLMVMYADEKFNVPITKRAIVRYLYACSLDKGEGVTGESEAARPEHALKADENLKLLKKMDPETVVEAKRYPIR